MFSDPDEKYQALLDRNPKAEGKFVYCVISTKIYCRPTCYSRLAKRCNIIFVDTSHQALRLGFRPCKRCKPNISHGWNHSRDFILSACKLIYKLSLCETTLDTSKVLSHIKVSKWHFFRTFKKYTGITPKEFFLKCLECKMDPLSISPLPLIETKKNMKLRSAKALEAPAELQLLQDESDEHLYLNSSFENQSLVQEQAAGKDPSKPFQNYEPSLSDESQFEISGISSPFESYNCLLSPDKLVDFDFNKFFNSSETEFLDYFNDDSNFYGLLQLFEA